MFKIQEWEREFDNIKIESEPGDDVIDMDKKLDTATKAFIRTLANSLIDSVEMEYIHGRPEDEYERGYEGAYDDIKAKTKKLRELFK
jgi:hypothetical protein